MRSFDSTFNRVYFGQHRAEPSSIARALAQARIQDLDFVVTPIRQASHGKFDDLIDTRNVPSSSMSSSVVGVLSDLDVETCLHPERIVAEWSWAVHCSFYAVVLNSDGAHSEQVTKLVSQYYETHGPDLCLTRLWISVDVGSWQVWDRIRRDALHPARLCVYLRIENMHQISQNCLDRWLGEPVAVFELPPGFEESETTLKFAQQLIQRNAQPVLRDSAGIRHIFEYLEKSPPLTWEEAYVSPYHDQLQLPLQPLAENMENTVYETFEEDRMKYDLYERAIHQGLVDFLKSHKRREIRISVVGAGRGGLIDSAIRAISRISDDSMSFYIDGVEKNPNAARTLRYKVRDDALWCSDRRTEITIVESDMRSWKPSTLVDIMVSELLGSFGDNEASPECIFGAWSCLNPDGGICIPQRYVSSLEPVSCEKAWVTARETHKLEHLLVSALYSCYKPCNPEFLFEFDHRSPPGPSDRSKTLSWVVDIDSTIHGFVGFFHCELYGDVVLSIHPPTKSSDMVSWFPAFLPLKDPLHVASGQTISARVDRKVQADKLWFEWTVTAPIPQATNNSNGAVYTIGLS